MRAEGESEPRIGTRREKHTGGESETRAHTPVAEELGEWGIGGEDQKHGDRELEVVK